MCVVVLDGVDALFSRLTHSDKSNTPVVSQTLELSTVSISREQ